MAPAGAHFHYSDHGRYHYGYDQYNYGVFTDDEEEFGYDDEDDVEDSDEFDRDDRDDGEKMKPTGKLSRPIKSEYAHGRSEEDLQTQIWSALGKLQAPTAYATSKHFPSASNPGLYIPEHGTIGMPLSTSDANVIVSRAKQAALVRDGSSPLGNNPNKCWEIASPGFFLHNPSWVKQVQDSVSAVYTAFGLTCGVQNLSYKLSKLVLYEPGACAQPQKEHRGESASTVFGTLEICLPSAHTGGKLVLRADGQEEIFETDRTSNFDVSIGAWYSDVDFEMTPITSGFRLGLVYDLMCDPLYRDSLRSADTRQNRTHLTELLKVYQEDLKHETSSLPRFLVHKLEDRYTEHKFKFEALRDGDKTQVAALQEMCNSLKFRLYLATWELRLVSDVDNEEVEREEYLKMINELDGSPVADRLEVPIDAVTDPSPGEGYEPDNDYEDSEYEDGPWGEEGNVTHYYRDNVVLIVPPARMVDFFCAYDVSSLTTLGYLNELKSEIEAGHSKQAQIVQLCQHILKDLSPIPSWRLYDPQGRAKTQLRSEAVKLALDHGEIELFHNVCQRLSGQTAIEHAEALGIAAARFGLDRVGPCLKVGVQAASDLLTRRHFLQKVEHGFIQCQAPTDNSLEALKCLSDNLLFDMTFNSKQLQNSEATTLVETSKMLGWKTYEAKANAILEISTTAFRVLFLNEFTCQYSNLDGPKTQFVTALIKRTWDTFIFNMFRSSSAKSFNMYGGFSTAGASFPLHGRDIMTFLSHSLELMPSYNLDDFIIPRLLTAIPSAPKEVCAHTFIEFIIVVLENLSTPFILSESPPTPSHPQKVLVQSMLIQYLRTNVGRAPVEPRDWSFPRRGCGCNDCKFVDTFMQDPQRTVLDFACAQPRRKHLDERFTRAPDNSYNVEIIKDRSPYTWRVTKDRSGYIRERHNWLTNRETAIQTMRLLGRDTASLERLKSYMDPHWDTLIQADIGLLPEITLRAPLQALSQHPAGPTQDAERTTSRMNTRSGNKRGRSDVSSATGGSGKKARLDGGKENAGGGNVEVEVVDLTDL